MGAKHAMNETQASLRLLSLALGGAILVLMVVQLLSTYVLGAGALSLALGAAVFLFWQYQRSEQSRTKVEQEALLLQHQAFAAEVERAWERSHAHEAERRKVQNRTAARGSGESEVQQRSVPSQASSSSQPSSKAVVPPSLGAAPKKKKKKKRDEDEEDEIFEVDDKLEAEVVDGLEDFLQHSRLRQTLKSTAQGMRESQGRKKEKELGGAGSAEVKQPVLPPPPTRAAAKPKAKAEAEKPKRPVFKENLFGPPKDKAAEDAKAPEPGKGGGRKGAVDAKVSSSAKPPPPPAPGSSEATSRGLPEAKQEQPGRAQSYGRGGGAKGSGGKSGQGKRHLQQPWPSGGDDWWGEDDAGWYGTEDAAWWGEQDWWFPDDSSAHWGADASSWWAADSHAHWGGAGKGRWKGGGRGRAPGAEQWKQKAPLPKEQPAPSEEL
eukprot:TRINITY_DN12874_c0_g1_i1.p1 TRINITY_DN12874_c0_g1~~TRINITY_DN12874_c0_g1_i1.p1  ORF type:complete len:435 (+),score=131.53 TRINITY_DN12874_c0_g1_i1:25-1329(+)